jgi:multidrug resistance efflux pump
VHIRFHRNARTTPEAIDGFKVPYGAAKRSAPKWRWRLILAVVFSPVFYLAYSAGKELLTLSAEGNVSLAQYNVRAPAAGRTVRVDVAIGAKVAKGDILVQLDDPGLDADISERAAAAGNPARTPPGTPTALQEELELDTRILRSAEQRLADMRDLLSQGAATSGEVREAQISADEATAAVLRARQQMRGSRGEAPSSQPPELQRLLAAREQLTVRAPADGYVVEILTRDSEMVSAGAPLLLLSGNVEPEVLAYVRPELLKQVHAGSAATVRLPDGAKMQAVVGDGPLITQHALTEPDNPLGGRSPTVVLHLQSLEPWPRAARINGLPVSVRFHYGWEPRTQSHP